MLIERYDFIKIYESENENQALNIIENNYINMDGLNYRKLYRVYSILRGGTLAIEPKTLFKVLVYGYMNG